MQIQRNLQGTLLTQHRIMHLRNNLASLLLALVCFFLAQSIRPTSGGNGDKVILGGSGNGCGPKFIFKSSNRKHKEFFVLNECKEEKKPIHYIPESATRKSQSKSMNFHHHHRTQKYYSNDKDAGLALASDSIPNKYFKNGPPEYLRNQDSFQQQQTIFQQYPYQQFSRYGQANQLSNHNQQFYGTSHFSNFHSKHSH